MKLSLYKDARTGKFVTKAYADAHPATTYHIVGRLIRSLRRK